MTKKERAMRDFRKACKEYYGAAITFSSMVKMLLCAIELSKCGVDWRDL